MTWNVDNPKGRIASILSVVMWSSLLTLLVINGHWSWYTILLMLLFGLLLALSFMRIYQEWKEGGEWLGD